MNAPKIATVSLWQMKAAARDSKSSWRTYAIATSEGGILSSWNSARYPRLK